MRSRSASAASRVEGLGRGLGLQAEPLGDLPQLGRRLGLLVARLLRAHLGGRDRVAAGAQALLDLRLQARARAQLGGDALALAAVGEQLLLDRRHPGGDRLQRVAQHLGEPLGGRPERRVAGDRDAQALDRRGALLALARGALGDAPLGRELALDLGAADRRRTPGPVRRGARR